MAVPLIYAGVMLGRFAIPVIARYIIKNGAKKAAKKFGTKVVANAKVTKQIKQLKTITKSTTKTVKGKVVKTKTKPKVEMKNISAKNKNIAEKVEKTVRGKPIKPKKIKAKPSKTDLIKKVDKKTSVKTKPKVDKKVDKKSLATKSKTSKVKDTKKADKKVDKKSLATKNKQDKLVAEQQKKYLLEKTVRGKPIPKNKSLVTVKPKVKPKVKKNFKPAPFITGNTVMGGVLGGLTTAGVIAYLKGKNKKAPNIPKGLTPPSVLNPKPSTGTGRGEGSKETTRRRKDAVGSARKSSGPTTRSKLTMDRGNSFENRIRRLVSKKDALTKIESGDGRSEYQVRMNKLKKENPKEFKKLFKMGGFGNLKD